MMRDMGFYEQSTYAVVIMMLMKTEFRVGFRTDVCFSYL